MFTVKMFAGIAVFSEIACHGVWAFELLLMATLLYAVRSAPMGNVARCLENSTGSFDVCFTYENIALELECGMCFHLFIDF